MTKLLKLTMLIVIGCFLFVGNANAESLNQKKAFSVSEVLLSKMPLPPVSNKQASCIKSSYEEFLGNAKKFNMANIPTMYSGAKYNNLVTHVNNFDLNSSPEMDGDSFKDLYNNILVMVTIKCFSE